VLSTTSLDMHRGNIADVLIGTLVCGILKVEKLALNQGLRADSPA